MSFPGGIESPFTQSLDANGNPERACDGVNGAQDIG
jgi:hypothetical protein